MHCVAADTVGVVFDTVAAVVAGCTVLVCRNRPYREYRYTFVLPFLDFDIDVDDGIAAAVR